MKIRDNETGQVFDYGTNRHHALRISEDGSCLTFENLQNGDGSCGGGYSFVLDDGKTPEESDSPDAVNGATYANIGGFGNPDIEKILQKIEKQKKICLEIDNGDEFNAGALDMANSIKDIVKKHLSRENHTETTRQSRDNDGTIGIDDDRLWNILFEEACVEGQQAERIYNRLKEICGDGWTPCSERMPECEQEVYILTERGTKTTALYEDGKMPESKSKWHWNDIQGEWDDEEDCMIIPEGWWEYRHFNPDDVYNNVVDEKVIAWQPLPEPYKPPVESTAEKSMREREEFFKKV